MLVFKKIIKVLIKLISYIIRDFRRKYVNQIFPPKPTVINLNANDICNSKCTMCNIWKQKKDYDFSPQELQNILSDKFFQNVKNIGITGGEPTLREDLPLLYEACCKAIPGLKGLSIITNAIKENEVIERILEVNTICKKYGKTFSMMVSLDGIEEVHDKIRGRKGNFKTAIKIINYFRTNSEIPITIGCTISKGNVWEVDELLDFLKENNLYGRFRIAEYINRLYNQDRSEVIRNYTREEEFHLISFFKKLELSYEINPDIKRTYRSIINVLEGGKRKIGCPYQDKGIVLDSRSDLRFCAPKSEIIGNTLNNSATKIVKNNLKERRRILRQNCDDCIHDYHAPITFIEKIEEIKNTFWKEFYTINNLYKAKFLIPIIKLRKRRSRAFNIFITGWYGTETVGDKAILGHIYEFYCKKFPGAKFYISSMYPFVTQKTLEELTINAEIVSVESFDFAYIAATSDEIVMGGGPLMDMESLAIPLWAFKMAKLFKKKTVIFGCGLGPLKVEKYRKATLLLLQLADKIKLRDDNSIKEALNLDNALKLENYGDGASFYIIKKLNPLINKKNILGCYLREWPYAYSDKSTTYNEYLILRKKYEELLAKIIKSICLEYNLEPYFFPMHTFVVGHDDRDFFRRFIKENFNHFNHFIHKENSSVEFITEKMQEAKFNLCMRFHSVLFANTLNTDFHAIDYTNGGKIFGYLKDCKKLDKMTSITELDASDVLTKIRISKTHENEINT